MMATNKELRQHEEYIAYMEANRNHDSDRYFEVRPQLDNGHNKKIFESGYVRGYQAAHEELQAEIDALRKDAEWISVDDRLPDFIEGEDISENVLCIVDGKLTLGQRYYVNGEGWLWACGVGYVFGDLATVEIEADDDYQVTHWKPLPQPPKALAKDNHD